VGDAYRRPQGLDNLLNRWLDDLVDRDGAAFAGGRGNAGGGAAPALPKGIVIGSGATTNPATPSAADRIRTRVVALAAVAQVLLHSRPGSVSDKIARRTLNTGRRP
jgi:F0F1-type ATP synthase membrane subunit c/vacuolar-type H+-ATPase subunit K